MKVVKQNTNEPLRCGPLCSLGYPKFSNATTKHIKNIDKRGRQEVAFGGGEVAASCSQNDKHSVEVCSGGVQSRNQSACSFFF